MPDDTGHMNYPGPRRPSLDREDRLNEQIEELEEELEQAAIDKEIVDELRNDFHLFRQKLEDALREVTKLDAANEANKSIVSSQIKAIAVLGKELELQREKRIYFELKAEEYLKRLNTINRNIGAAKEIL